MRIHKDHLEEVLLRLQAQSKMGLAWMTYRPDDRSVRTNNIDFFKRKEEALKFRNSAKAFYYEALPVKPVIQVLQTMLELSRHKGLDMPHHIEFNMHRLLRNHEDLIIPQTLPAPAVANDLSTLKHKEMNENNYAYLKDNIKYMGFGETQHDELAQHLKEDKDAFQMTFKTEVNKKPFEAVLQFRRPENSDMYFLNSYHVSLERTNGDTMEQTFYLNKGKGVTAKEAYNLLEGRAVYKELTNKAGDSYKAWIQLDFDNKDKNNNHEVKQYHENYGYDLKATVGKYAVMELDGGEKEKSLLQSLQKGNIQSVTINADGTDKKMFLEANPQYKAVTLYDGGMKRLQKEDLAQYQAVHPVNGKEIKQEEKAAQAKDIKETIKQRPDEAELPAKKRTKKKGVSI